MGVFSRCRKYVNELPKQQIFVTRELLTYGCRDAVDKCVQGMVRTGFIVRLARGVFVRNDADLKEPTIIQIAEAKARAFSKHLLPSKVAQAAALGLEKPPKQKKKKKKVKVAKKIFPPATATFSVLGTTSMFFTIHGYVKLEHISARKFFVAQHELGKMVAGIWHASAEAVFSFPKLMSKANFSVEEYKKLRQLAAWVPEWVHEYFRSEHDSLLVHVPWRLYPFTRVQFPEVFFQKKAKGVLEEEEGVYRLGTEGGADALPCGSHGVRDSRRLLGLLTACIWSEHKFNFGKDRFSSS